MDDTLPPNWVSTTLENVLSKLSDGSHNPPRDKGKGIPMLSSRNIFWDKLLMDKVRYISEDDYESEILRINIEANDILLTIVGTIGRVCIVPKNTLKFSLQRSVAILKPLISSRFLGYFLINPRIQEFLSDNAKGSAQKGIYLKALKQLPVIVPPLAEQDRIVEKLDAAFAKLKVVETALAEVPQMIADFRKSILYAAVTGELTNDWRVGKTLDISGLIAKLKRKNKDFKPITDGEKKFNIPSSWKLVRLSFISDIIMGQSPPGDSYNSEGKGIPLINGPVEFSADPFGKTLKVKFTTKPTNKYCQEGDLIICVRGSTTGRINIADFKACIGRGVAAIRATEVYQKYINLFMRLQYEDILSSGKGSTFPSINSDFLKDYIIPLPTLEEQEEIIEKSSKLLQQTEELESIYLQTIKEVEEIRRQSLSFAFLGKLVKQDPNDEPASLLLEKIKVEKERIEQELKAQRKKRRTQPKKKKVMKNLDIIEVLKIKAKPMTAEEVWRESKYNKDIDGFYEALRKEVEETETVLSMVAEDEVTYLSLKEEDKTN